MPDRRGTGTPKEEEDRFRYGWREVRRVGDNGEELRERVPLTEEDILHPLEGDVIMQHSQHARICIYLHAVFPHPCTRAMPEVGILFDCRTDWQVGNVAPHCPDLVVLGDVAYEWDLNEATAQIRSLAWRPLLVIEVTSDTTRNNDLEKKLIEYHQVGIPLYVIVDRLAEPSEPRFIGYQHTPAGYVRGTRWMSWAGCGWSRSGCGWPGKGIRWSLWTSAATPSPTFLSFTRPPRRHRNRRRRLSDWPAWRLKNAGRGCRTAGGRQGECPLGG